MTEVTHKNLAEALCAFQAEAPTLYKTAEAKAGSYSYKYVDLADIVDVIRPIMAKHGLSFSAFPCLTTDGKPGLRYTLRHVSGDVESDVMSLMIGKADAQGHGSAITYARRYALCAVLNIVADKDDDGAAAKAAVEREREQREQHTNGNGGISRERAKTIMDAIAEAGIGATKLRMKLVALGVEDVPEVVTGQTLLHLTPEQADELTSALNAVIDAQAASNGN